MKRAPSNVDSSTATLDVFEIERFAIHDGPGIRTVIFLQGCPLTCPWCSNPESQPRRPQLLYVAGKCTGCGSCREACATNCITFVDGRPAFDRRRCTACRRCAVVCPQHAIRFAGQAMSVDQIMDVVRRDEAYYHRSGGGVTVSGGEAFMQHRALIPLLTRCKRDGLHTAIETSGAADTEVVRRTMPFVDLFLFDLKHPDPRILRRETGADLERILCNLRCLAAADPSRVIVRVPIIPGFNDDAAVARELFAIARRQGIRRIHLLPFHALGRDKYEQLGIPYRFRDVAMLTHADLLPLQRIAQAMHLDARIGG